jgi:long-chain acyl-CoA synthetase
METFIRNDTSRVYTRDVPGITNLLACLKDNSTIVASQSSDRPIEGRASSEQRLLCETSGTSGPPKTISRRPETWIKCFEVSKSKFHVSKDDTYATFGSLGHSLGLYAILEGLWLGAGICNLSNMGPRRQVSALTEIGVTVIYATPTQLKVLLKGAEVSQISAFPLVKKVFCGGGKLTPELKSSLGTFFPTAEIYEFFGASETSFIAISDSTTPEGSVGRAYPGVKIQIGIENNSYGLQTGEIWIKSPYLFDGYASGQCTDTVWCGDYLSIGEMGYMNEDGYLFVQGRKDRMITVADFNVYPEEIEQTISALDQVECCAVVSKVDAQRGNIPICVVQLSENKPDVLSISSRCRKVLGQHSVPREYHFVSKMPLLASGKPDLEVLRQTYGIS